MVVGKVEDKKCKDDVIKVIRTAIMSKQYGLEDFLASVVVESCSKYFLLFCNMVVLILVYSLEAFLAFVFQCKVNANIVHANIVQSLLNVNPLNSQLYRLAISLVYLSKVSKTCSLILYASLPKTNVNKSYK